MFALSQKRLLLFSHLIAYLLQPQRMQTYDAEQAQQIVLSSLPKGDFEGIFFNVSLSRARNALIRAGIASSEPNAEKVLDHLVENAFLAKQSRGSDSWFYKPIGAPCDYSTEFDYILARFRHEVPDKRHSSLIGKGTLASHGVLVGCVGRGLAIDWCDARYFHYLTKIVRVMPCADYTPLVREWGFASAQNCPYSTGIFRGINGANQKFWKFDDNSTARFEVYLAKHNRALTISLTPPSSQQHVGGAPTMTQSSCGDDDGSSCDMEADDLDETVDVVEPASCLEHSGRCLQLTFNNEENEGRNTNTAPMELPASVFNPARAERERMRLVQGGYNKDFLDGLVPITTFSLPDTPRVADSEVPLAAIPARDVRWAIRAVLCTKDLRGLRLLHEVNNERMLPDLTHSACRPNGDPGVEMVVSYVKKLPLERVLSLHDNLQHLRNSVGLLRKDWFHKQIAEDAESVGRRLRLELWELRFPGWLIKDVVSTLGATLFTVEIEQMLEEIVLARFPALKHVPDTIRADVLITFGRTESMQNLLLLMEKLIPNYALRGGRLTASPCAVICPAFVSREDFLRPLCEWSCQGLMDRWSTIREKLIEARNGAVRRILDVPGYCPGAAPW
jgi:hypothetical protein